MTVGSAEPGDAVIAAFGLGSGHGEVLHDGDETSIRVGDVVLKQVGDAASAAWAQSVLTAVRPTLFRVPRPLTSRDGRWVVDGWSATEFVDGLQPLVKEPQRTVDVGRELAALLTDRVSGAAEVVRRRTDRWALADRVAWRELEATSLGLNTDVCEMVERLTGDIPRCDDAVTVIHGDLAGNVFLDASGSAVVLDLSPYVRPAPYGAAIVVVDHMLWYEGSTELSRLVDASQLARALTFRMIADQIGRGPGEDPDDSELVAVTSIADVLGL